jgi:hypothetical protein
MELGSATSTSTSTAPAAGKIVHVAATLDPPAPVTAAEAEAALDRILPPRSNGQKPAAADDTRKAAQAPLACQAALRPAAVPIASPCPSQAMEDQRQEVLVADTSAGVKTSNDPNCAAGAAGSICTNAAACSAANVPGRDDRRPLPLPTTPPARKPRRKRT